MAGLVGTAAAELEARLRDFVREGRLPGAAAGVVRGDELAWQAAVGFADAAARRPGRPDALYRIASITKTLTGTAVLQLRDAGRLDLDDPAVAYLPELRGAVSPLAAIEAVTVRRMLSHQSGLPAEPPGTDWSVPAYQGEAAATLARASDIAVSIRPGSRHKYSDLAYQLLGEIVTRVSGTPYPRYLREAILDPLGMTATGFEPLAGPLLERSVSGYGWRALSDELEPAPAMPPVWAEGGLWSCVADLARWVSFQLCAYREPPDDSPVLAAASRREMHQPRYLADDAWARAWGIAWCGSRRDDGIWIQHSGGLPGFTSIACFDPRAQVGAVVLANGTTGGVDVGFDLASAARRLTRAEPPAPEAPAAAPGAYRPLLGLYARPGLGGWVLRLEWRDGRLAFVSPEAPGWGIALQPTSDPDVFTAGPGSDWAGEAVTFRRRGDGRVLTVLLMNWTMVRLDHVPPDHVPPAG
jgi:CubicO group peptidase (beta-lactamase class C family)